MIEVVGLVMVVTFLGMYTFNVIGQVACKASESQWTRQIRSGKWR